MKKGFTLLEILLVIAAIGILAAIVIVAINPQRQLASVRNAKRQSDVNTINNAIQQYLIEERSYPTGISSQFQNICGEGETEGCIDLSSQLVPQYLAGIPRDPSGLAYQVAMNPVNERVSVLSPAGEIGQNIGINLFGIIAIGGNTSTVQYEDNVYTVHRFTEEGTFSLDILNTGVFDQEVRFTTTVGSTFNGIDSRGDSISPTNQGYEVVVSSGGRVDVAYPQGAGTNDIAFSTINPVPVQATGGSVSDISINNNEYRVHTFSSTGASTFTVSSLGNFEDNDKLEYLVIAGGGAGGTDGGVGGGTGGGGAGGYRSSVSGESSGANSSSETPITLSVGSYNVVVGAGGAGGGYNSGQNSSFDSIVSIGGGAGGRWDGGHLPGADGGSGGGSSYASAGGSGTAGQGFGAQTSSYNSPYNGGGGGGAGAIGTRGSNFTPVGGDGISSSITGSAVFRAGGGGGGINGNSSSTGAPGLGGGGAGASKNAGVPAESGQPNTGGGGGGAVSGNLTTGGSGGSGVVIVRYPLRPLSEGN